MLRKTGLFICVLIVVIGTFLVIVGNSHAQSGSDVIVNESLSINATIDNNYAITTLSQTLRNPSEDNQEATISYTIPESAFLSQFILKIDGVIYTSRVVEKEAAKEQYEGAKESNKTATIVESSTTTSTSSFTYKINIKAGEEITYLLVYEEYIPRIKGTYTYSIPLTKNSYPSEGDMSIYVGLESVAGFNDITVPDYPNAAVEYLLTKSGSINYHPEIRSFSSDFNVVYSIIEYPPEGFLMNYEIGDEGYFFHVFCPGMDDVGGDALGKDIVFIIDHSGSMSGSKMDQTKDAFSSIIDDLRSQDRFNIIRFDDSIETFKTSLVDATEENIDDGDVYIQETSADGSTDINAALLKGLEMFSSENSNVPIICFLTDGLPTSGTTGLSTIRQNVINDNNIGAAIFCLAFGNDCDMDFLKAIALENDGTATKIEVGKDASDQIVGYYDTFSTPLVTKLNIDYGEDTWDVFPTYVPSLYQGSEVVIVGRYDTDITSMHSNITGETSDGETDFSQEFSLEGRTEYDFIPRYWASQKIKELQDQILIDGETHSLKENITRIAVEYQFITAYTSMILVIEETDEDSSSTESNEWEDPEEESREEEEQQNNYQQPDSNYTTDSDYEYAPPPDDDNDGEVSGDGDDDITDDDVTEPEWWDSNEDGLGDNSDPNTLDSNKDENQTNGPTVPHKEEKEQEESSNIMIIAPLILIILIISGIIVAHLLTRNKKK
jgi:uncharacterized protein YegL